MNKLDTQLLEILLANNGTFDQVISQIKQSILKAIMEKMPEKDEVIFGEEDNYDDNRRNEAIEEFESVIKEILQTKTNE